MSMVLTCYNRQDYIKEAILSVFAQDYDGPMQLVIVDDASTDDSVRIIEETVQEHGAGWDVEIVKLKQNLGVAGATDAGWAKAKHDWILIVDGDDIQHANRCSMIAELSERYPGLGQVSFSMRNIDKKGNPFGYASYGNMAYEDAPDELYIDSPMVNCRNHFGALEGVDIRSCGAATAFHRNVWDMWGPLCQGETCGMRFEQDPTWAFRVALSKPILGSKQIGLEYRMHGSNLSNIELAEGVAGIMQFERHQEKYQAFRASSLICKLRDLRRAMSDKYLTNWSAEELLFAQERLETELAGCQLRSMWWSISYCARFWRVMRNWRRFRQSGTSLLRLLPFRLFCLLKYWRKR